MSKSPLRNAIIDGHRQLIFNRYDYDQLVSNYDIPDEFGVQDIDALRKYFVNYVYPESSRRSELEDGFKTLDEIIRSPSSIIALLKDSFSIMITYGRQLPGLLQMGMKAMKSFVSASNLERAMTDEAQRQNLSPPFDESVMVNLLTTLPDEMLDHHVASFWPLYDALLDESMLRKALKIIDSLIIKMKDRPNTYTKETIEGIHEGKMVLEQGLKLFSQYDVDTRKRIIEQVKLIEKDAYEAFKTTN